MFSHVSHDMIKPTFLLIQTVQSIATSINLSSVDMQLVCNYQD